MFFHRSPQDEQRMARNKNAKGLGVSYKETLDWAQQNTYELEEIRKRMAELDRVKGIRAARADRQHRRVRKPLMANILHEDGSYGLGLNYDRAQVDEALKLLRGRKEQAKRWSPGLSDAGMKWACMDGMAKRIQEEQEAKDKFRIYFLEINNKIGKLKPTVQRVYILEAWTAPSYYHASGFDPEGAVTGAWRDWSGRTGDKLAPPAGRCEYPYSINNRVGNEVAEVRWQQYSRESALNTLRRLQANGDVLLSAWGINAKELMDEVKNPRNVIEREVAKV